MSEYDLKIGELVFDIFPYEDTRFFLKEQGNGSSFIANLSTTK